MEPIVLKKILLEKHSVCASVGGFANHYRWLLLLSEKYNSLDSLNANSFLRNNKAFPWKVKDKVTFIRDNVYCAERNFSNWITHEWKFRGALDHILPVNHDIEVTSKSFKSDLVEHKMLASILDPLECLRHYIKFNPKLNSFTEEGFLQRCKDEIQKIKTFVPKTNEKILIVEGSRLYKSVLDESLYQEIINFFQLEDLYPYANEIHQMWYRIHNA